MTGPVLRLDGISKRFGELVANDGIGLELRAGEILALLGENGAGKTTLMNILFGHYVADAGTIEVAGPDGLLRPLRPGTPRAALEAGIGMVHQHFTLADNLSALDNILLGTEPLLRPISRRLEARAKVQELMARSGLEVEIDAPVRALSVGERQRVEILKALYRDARILILDEPTAVLTPQEADELFGILEGLAAHGLAIVFISHKLGEVLALSRRIVVLRAGRVVAELATAEAERAQLAELMVGRPVRPTVREPLTPGRPVVELDRIDVEPARGRPLLSEVELSVREREIVGIAGVAGNGQAALADRHRPEVQRWGWLRRVTMRARAGRIMAAYDVRAPGPEVRVGLLSGGNMQKLILGRELERDPAFILADQPTRGLDVGAVADIHRRLLAARSRGAGILLISEDLDELLTLADRIAVIHRGRLSPALPTEQLSVQALGLMMGGHGGAEPAHAA